MKKIGYILETKYDMCVLQCVYNEDGSVDIILSKDEPENAANWLPVGEGGFHLYMRIYLPDMDALTDWQAPVINAK